MTMTTERDINALDEHERVQTCEHSCLSPEGVCLDCGDRCSGADVGAEDDGICHDPECPIHGAA